MSQKSREEVEHVAHLARLRLDEVEIEKITHEFNALISFVHKLDEVDTKGVEPMSRPVTPAQDESGNHPSNYPLADLYFLREDQLQPSLSVEEALQNTLIHSENQFQVPRILRK